MPKQSDIHIFVHVLSDGIEQKLDQIILQGDSFMSSIADLQAAVAAEDTQIAAIETLVTGLVAQIAAIPPSTDPATQAALDALVADATAQTAGLVASIAAATPAPVVTP